MIPRKVPFPLQNLTQVEEMLIARAFPVLQVYTKPRGGQRSYKGHVITLPRDVQKIADILPRHPKDIPVIVFNFNNKNNASIELKVRRQNVLDALVWLTGVSESGEPNNFLYKDIVINYEKNLSLQREIASSETQSFSEKIKHLIKFAEQKGNQWYYRFAAHPRFAFWAYNMLYRRRLLGQGSFYIKQNPSDANLTLNELQEMVQSGTHEIIMKKLLHYAKNVSGTNVYWHDAKEQLKATIIQAGTPTIFWTLSCAEFHWPEFHSLLSSDRESDSRVLRDNIINNPHLIDWFFTVRVENFVKYWLYKVMGAEWHWYRFEYAVMRGSIHCHGLAKLQDDPDLCKLSQLALKGYLANRKIEKGFFQSDEYEMLQQSINEGKSAEDDICNYVDSIVTAMNPSPAINEEWVKPDFHPCKRRFNNIPPSEFEEDYAYLANLVQRHTLCNSAYCLRKGDNTVQYCRSKFPFETCKNTHIEYEEVHTRNQQVAFRPKIVLKRNDPRINRHQRLQLQSWRANIDIQPIIDHNACLEYIAKYASKAEKLSTVVRDAFVNVIGNLKTIDSTHKVIRKLMIKAVGERDFSAQEVMHHILSLKLFSSSFQVISTFLDGSRKVTIKNDNVETKPSTLDNYANRSVFEGCTAEVLQCNFVNFVAKYTLVKDEIKKRSKTVVVRTYPNYYSNQKVHNILCSANIS